ncbi:hypothetical protein GOY14_02540 [Wolbachia endosymbiont of Dipetalonema caudispina]|uniref:TolC family protein n=1 Tax=Wolbachia endosymbiont of Dipetalonema caudispina TaxID=1812112 RepID=UPI00158DD5F1|nr:TolC family protein [Wolbachia endosymbiont of Dipetalonema caudispina]QKX01196.1 hypothetical protein GOY14_02540 [Wolbachia endosymbiont of Dipetalonema caudispina]
MSKFIIIFMVVFGSISCYAINLEEAINKAIKNSLKLKSQLYQYKSIEKQLKSSGLAGFLPDINLQYNFDSNFNFYDKKHNLPEKHLTLRQKVIGGGSFATFNQSSHLLKAEKILFQQSKQEVALNAVKVYTDVLKRTAILKLKEHKERVSLENLSAVKKRFSLGEVTNTEVSLAKAKFSSSVLDRIDAEGKLKLANIAYSHLIGEDPDKLSEVNDKLPSVPELNECLQLAKTKNLSLKVAIHKKKADGMAVISEISKWLPSLNLSASKSLNESINLNTLLNTTNITFTLDIPILTKGTTTFSISKAKMNAKKSAYDYYEIIKYIEKEVIKTWNNVLIAKTIIKASQKVEKAAAFALEEVKQEVNLNLKSKIELLDTENALLKARSDLVEAKNNYAISVYKLLLMTNSINF